VSDVGLGLEGDGIVEPIWAADETLRDPERGGTGLIREFDGSAYLQDEEITLQAHIHSDIAAPPPTSIVYDVDVPAAFRVGDMWLPEYVPGLALAANTEVRSAGEATSAGQLRTYEIPGTTDPEIVDGARVEFFFLLDGAGPNDIYCGRLDRPNAGDWYRSVRPWAIEVRNVITQRGGVSILENVINPGRGETVKLRYVLGSSGYVMITVFDLKGDIVDILYRGRRSAGEYSTAWDGRNRGGRIVARGIYFIKVVGPGIEEVRKVLVVK